MSRAKSIAPIVVASALLACTAIVPEAMGAGASNGTTAQTEIQLGLCSPPDQIERALDLRPHGAPLEVWLFDDPALTLFQRGLRARLRVGAKSSDLTLKIANQDCASLASELVPAAEGKCEFDMHGTTVAGAVSLTRGIGPSATRDLLAGKLPLGEALSAAQIRYLRDVVHAWPLPAGLRPLGPQRVSSLRAKGKPYDVNVSRIPGGETYIEISRKVPAADAVRLRAALVDDLTHAGVSICADQSAQALNKLRALQR